MQIVFNFNKKTGLIFHANWGQVALINVKSCFLGKIRKIFQMLSVEKFTLSAETFLMP